MHQAGPNKPIYNDAWKHKKLNYSYVAVCMFCVITICFSLLLCDYSNYVFLIFFLFRFLVLYFCFLYSLFLYCFVYCSPFVYSCIFRIFVQFYRPLPPGWNPMEVNNIIIIIIINTIINQKSRFHSAKTVQTRDHHITHDSTSDEFTATWFGLYPVKSQNV